MSAMQSALITAALCIASLAAAQSASPMPDKEARVAAQQTVQRFMDSWNHSGGATYGENYGPDAELVDPTGTIVPGSIAIAKEHVDLLAGIFKGSHVEVKVRKIRRLDANHIIVDFDTELSHIQHPPPGAPAGAVLKSHLKHILEKRKGEWKVVAAQNTFIAAQ
jgi:uncharacterized protein (TIGR02246 family)